MQVDVVWTLLAALNACLYQLLNYSTQAESTTPLCRTSTCNNLDLEVRTLRPRHARNPGWVILAYLTARFTTTLNASKMLGTICTLKVVPAV